MSYSLNKSSNTPMIWQNLERLGLSVCGLRNLDEGMNFFDCLLGPFLIIFWMFSKSPYIDWMKLNPFLEKNWLVEQLIIMIWKRFYQMDLLIFSWKEGLWKKFGVFEGTREGLLEKVTKKAECP